MYGNDPIWPDIVLILDVIGIISVAIVIALSI